MTTVAVLGLGAMGSRIASRLMAAQHDVVTWNRSREKARELVAAGAQLMESPAEASAKADVVLSMLADAPALRNVFEGPGGALEGLVPGSTVIDMSTVGIDAVLHIASELPAGVSMLDAPVMGSMAEARDGSLTIFVGGPETVFDRWSALLAALGSAMFVGPLGAGATAKLVANASLFGILTVLGETIRLADALGLPREATFAVLAATPLAEQAARRRASIEADRFDPRFRLSLARKDAELILQAARTKHLELALARLVRDLFTEAETAGWRERDYTALLSWIAQRPGGTGTAASRDVR
jgi:3-hydroxyisobutyrate dehydrogenase-like beta-hydroxyacid dehydrogenase